MNYVIVDLEATCWEKNEDRQHEIIEIGAVCIGANQRILGEFVSLIKPVQHPILSDFCTELTTITQEMVEEGVLFKEGIAQFLDWIRSFGEDFALCSWGFYDKSQFKQECTNHHLDTDWLENHISVKHQYARIKGLNKPVGMDAALRNEGFTLDGTHHRGIDDAKNIAKIFLAYFEEWQFSVV